ncbi:hypothetical protein MTO96_016258 [Rhipicephalus appendiculatus]
MDIVWDRSGFTAMKVEDRGKYAAVIKNLLAPDFSYGMWTVVYDAETVLDSLAPRSAGESALREHFGDVAARIALADFYVEERALLADGGGPFTFCMWHMTPPVEVKTCHLCARHGVVASTVNYFKSVNSEHK